MSQTVPPGGYRRSLARRNLLRSAVGAFLLATASDEPQGLHGPLYSRCSWGGWALLGLDTFQNHLVLESLVRSPLSPFLWFQRWGQPWPQDLVNKIKLAYTPLNYGLVATVEAFDVNFSGVLQGSHDQYLRELFAAAAECGYPVDFRFFHEMNGNWYPWSVTHWDSNVDSTDEFLAVWRHVYGLLREEWRPHLRMVFCVNAWDIGGVSMESYWPGSDSVDALAIDGYNFAWMPDGSPKESSASIIGPMYSRFERLNASLPILVSELGCQAGPGKADWLKDLFTLPKFPRIESVTFFSQKDDTFDFSLDSDARSLSVCRKFLAESRNSDFL